MTEPVRHDFADGKYTVINDNGKLTALRYGEPWKRDLTGNNLIYWMLCEVDNLKAELATAKDAYNALSHELDAARQFNFDRT